MQRMEKMDKELFEELEANLIHALELVRSAQTNQNSPQEQISDEKVPPRSFVVRSRQSVDLDELDEQRQDCEHFLHPDSKTPNKCVKCGKILVQKWTVAEQGRGS